MNEENLPAKIDRAFVRVSEFYADELVPLRATISAVPIIGGGMDMILASEGQKAAKRRLNVLLRETHERMEQLEKETIDKEFLKSEEFIDLVLKAFESAIKTRDDEKIRLYARVLTESTVQDKREKGYFPEEYLNLLADLSPKQLKVARSLYMEKPQIKGEEWQQWATQVCNDIGIDQRDLPVMLSRLESSGLLERVTSDGTWGALMNPIEPRYKITSSFGRLMEFLELEK